MNVLVVDVDVFFFNGREKSIFYRFYQSEQNETFNIFLRRFANLNQTISKFINKIPLLRINNQIESYMRFERSIRGIGEALRKFLLLKKFQGEW